MKKLFFIVFGLIFSVTALYSQELLDSSIKEAPKSVKRYDFVEVDRFQYDTYTVLVITDCITNEKEYKLQITYDDDRFVEKERVSYFSDGVVAELLKTFRYLITTDFEPEVNGEKSFIIGRISNGLYFKVKPDSYRLELFIEGDHLLARLYDDYAIKEFASLLLEIEKTFEQKGRSLKDAVITNDDENELILFRL